MGRVSSRQRAAYAEFSSVYPIQETIGPERRAFRLLSDSVGAADPKRLRRVKGAFFVPLQPCPV
jgi:hypothetical protein